MFLPYAQHAYQNGTDRGENGLMYVPGYRKILQENTTGKNTMGTGKYYSERTNHCILDNSSPETISDLTFVFTVQLNYSQF